MERQLAAPKAVTAVAAALACCIGLAKSQDADVHAVPLSFHCMQPRSRGDQRPPGEQQGGTGVCACAQLPAKPACFRQVSPSPAAAQGCVSSGTSMTARSPSPSTCLLLITLAAVHTGTTPRPTPCCPIGRSRPTRPDCQFSFSPHLWPFDFLDSRMPHGHSPISCLSRPPLLRLPLFNIFLTRCCLPAASALGHAGLLRCDGC